MDSIEKVYEAFSDAPCPDGHTWQSPNAVETRYLRDLTKQSDGLDEFFYSTEDLTFIKFLLPKVLALKSAKSFSAPDWEGIGNHLERFGFERWSNHHKKAVLDVYYEHIQKAIDDEDSWELQMVLFGALILADDPKLFLRCCYQSNTLLIQLYESLLPDLEKHNKSDHDYEPLDIVSNWFKSGEFEEALSHAYESEHSS